MARNPWALQDPFKPRREVRNPRGPRRDPSVAYLESLPGPELQAFVDALPPGEYELKDLWWDFNGRLGFTGLNRVFRYAAQAAGMTTRAKTILIKPASATRQ
jgi:hypothetical protein